MPPERPNQSTFISPGESLRSLQTLAALLLGPIDPEQVLQEILRQATIVTGAANGSVSLLEENDDTTLRLRFGVGTHASRIGFRIKTNEGAVGEVWKTGRLFFIEDYRSWDNRVDDPLMCNLTTSLSAPLTSDGKMVGVLQLSWQDEPFQMDKETLDSFQQFSVFASIALEKATLFHHLQQESAVLEAMFNCVPGLIYLYDDQGLLVRWNKAFEKATDYSADELAKVHLMDWFSHNQTDAENVLAGLQRGRLEGFGDVEASILTKGGVTKQLYLTAVPLTIDNKSYMAGVGLDITEKKQAALALEKSQEEVRQHRDRLEIMVEDRTGDLVAANEELLALNQEITAMNETLENTNQRLEEEVAIRLQKEEELSRRDRQYRATTSLLTAQSQDVEECLESILRDALHLVKAPLGFLSLYDEKCKMLVIRHAIGPLEAFIGDPRPVDDSMQYQVFTAGKALYFEDYQKFAQRLTDPRLARLSSIIMVPLRQGIRTKGVLAISWLDEIHPLSDEDQEILRQYGDLASVVLDRSGAQESIARKNQLLQGLSDTSTALLGQLDLNSVLQDILDKAMLLTDIPHGFVRLFGPDPGIGPLSASRGRYTDYKDNSRKHIGGLYEEVLRTDEMVVIEDYKNWPQRGADASLADVTLALQAPLKVGGKIIGLVGLTAFGESVSLDEEKIAAVRQLATVASIAVKNALHHEETRELAFNDTLTGLPNRVSLQKHLDEEMELARTGAAQGVLFFIDLDELKTVNDTFGHSFGDEVIVTASRNLLSVLEENAFVARLGGDEFVVMISGLTDRAVISLLADNLVQALSSEYLISGQLIHMSASIGITLYPNDSTTAEDALKNADSAMYAAKGAGRNCWSFFESGLLEDAYEKILLTNNLRRALDKAELSLYYQPKVNVHSSRIVGFEALLRWNSPEYGDVSPTRFIPFAEQSGVILSIGRWVLEEACRFARQLAELGLGHLHVAVNISPRQLAAADFVSTVCESIAGENISARQLEVEVTESMFIESMEESISKLMDLRERGVSIALDDFGTGYSSLTYLRRLPVSTLKIDKSFIDTMLNDKTQAHFIGFIIDMAHNLGLTVVAEGVESTDQFCLLEKADCDCLQGYVFSRPVPEAVALRLAADNKKLQPANDISG